MYRIGWFSTGRDEAARQLLQAVVKAIQEGQIKAEFAFVFSNREKGEARESDDFLDLVDTLKVPLFCFSSKKFLPQLRAEGLREGSESSVLKEWRLAYDREVMRRLSGYEPDLCVLAGYMLILGPEMCRRYKIINLHPARPGGPVGTWQEVIWELVESRATETGVTMHLVTPELDKGPPVTYTTFPIVGKSFDKLWRQATSSPKNIKERTQDALFNLIREHGIARELPLIVATIKALAEGGIKIRDSRVFGRDGEIVGGYCLTKEIEAMLEGGLPN